MQTFWAITQAVRSFPRTNEYYTLWVSSRNIRKWILYHKSAEFVDRLSAEH